MNGLPRPAKPNIEPLAWASTMPFRLSVPAWITTPTHGQHHRELVGDELATGSQAAHQRVLVGRAPTGHEHADDRQRRDGQGEEDADVEVGDHEVLAGRQHDVEQQRRHQHDQRRRLEDDPVGLVGDEVLLLDELGAVGEQLEQAARSRLLRTLTALHPRHDLEQEHDAEDQRGGRHEDGRRRPA